jgi:hypothetical protein
MPFSRIHVARDFGIGELDRRHGHRGPVTQAHQRCKRVHHVVLREAQVTVGIHGKAASNQVPYVRALERRRDRLETRQSH